MKKRILALALALTMCFGTTMTTNAAMIVKNNMGALNTSNILDKNKSEIPKGLLQEVASKYKIEYTAEDLETLKKIFDADLYAKAYPDVARAYGNDREALWNHYVTYGLKEGRTQVNPAFNVFAYISAYPDLRNAFGDDLVAYYAHYANYGINENRKLTTIDAVTKAGITVSGMNGQVIARPVTPVSAPAEPSGAETASVPGSVPAGAGTESTSKEEPSKVPATPEPVKPTEQPPAPEPSGSTEVTPTPAPSGSAEETPTTQPEAPKPSAETCDHANGFSYVSSESNENMHTKKCEKCEYSVEENCEFGGDKKCKYCGRSHKPESEVGPSPSTK